MLSYSARWFVSRIKKDLILTYFYTGLEFHGMKLWTAVVRILTGI